MHSKIGMKAEMEITPTILTVLLSLIMTMVIMILVISQYVDTRAFLKSYTDISVAKRASYAFVSVYSTGSYSLMDPFKETYRFGMLDSEKLDDPYLLQASLMDLKLNARFTVKELSSGADGARLWTFDYVGLPAEQPQDPSGQQDLSPSGSYEPTEETKTFESLRTFMPIYDPVNRRVTNGVLYVEPY